MGINVITLPILAPIRMKTLSSRIRGFSLIELMIVIFIIIIIAAFVVPAASTVLRGSQLMQGSQILYDQLSLARQYALSKNHPIEVRLIRYADPETPGEASVGGGPNPPSNGNYRAIQIFETFDAIDQGTGDFVRSPIDKPAILPQSIVMDKGTLSSLISGAGGGNAAPASGNPSAKDPQMPRNVGSQYDYVYFRFMPDGSTNLPQSTGSTGQWFVTLHNINDNISGNTPPANFYTIQVDPVSGAMKQYRPGLAPQ
jgi:uncharacterized protein (TIGR02596 family)